MVTISGSNYEVETWADNDIDLENIPWIYQNHKSFVFGVQRPAGSGSFSIVLTVSIIYEPRHDTTNILVSDLVRHKPGCTATEDG